VPECLIELAELSLPNIRSLSVQGFRGILLCIIDTREPLPLQT
jgi:hypothetical protein